MSFDLGEFNFNSQGDDTGWRRWREKLNARKCQFESRWGVIIGKPVTLCLRCHAKPIEGVIEQIEPTATHRHPPPPPTAFPNPPPRIHPRGNRKSYA
ncbi:MAG: hypothetical protein ACNA8L_07985 [Luteolibacter sp.]